MGDDINEQLTDDQRTIFHQFRNRVEDVLKPYIDNYYLWRFLKARNFNIDKAEKMMREHMKSRVKYGADTILQTYKVPECIKNHFSFHHLGFDEEGNIVVAFITGASDIKGLYNSTSVRDRRMYTFYFMETLVTKMRDENKKTGKNGRRIITIDDLTDLNIRALLDKVVITGILDTLMIFQSNYPEILKSVNLINTPGFFTSWFNVIKKFIEPEPLSKFKIYGSDGWHEDIFRMVNPDIVPAFYGGNLTDPDGNELCLNIIHRDTKVPAKYYLKDTRLIQDPDMTKVLVREKTYYNHTVNTQKKNSVIKWTFQTVDYNIAFGIYYVPEGVKPMPQVSMAKFSKSFRHRVRRNSKTDHVVILPTERVDSQVVPEQGEIRCESIGTYLLHFDNTFSWMTPKELHYKVNVQLPSANDDEQGIIDINDYKMTEE